MQRLSTGNKDTTLSKETVSILIFLFALFCSSLLGMVVMRINAYPLAQMQEAVLRYIAGVLAGALLWPPILRALRAKRFREEAMERRKSLSLKILILAVATVVLLILFCGGFFFQRPWNMRGVASLLTGVLHPLAYLFFFARVPGSMHGRCFGGILALLEIGWIFFLSSHGATIASGNPEALFDLTRRLQMIRGGLITIIGITACLAIFYWQRHSKAEDPLPEDRQAALTPSCRSAFSPLIVICIAGLCYVLVGFLDSILVYTMRFYSEPPHMHLLLGFLFVISGIYIDKLGQQAARWLITICVCFSMLVPALIVTAKGGAVHFTLNHIAFLSQNLLFLVLSLAIGRGPYDGRLPGLMCVSILILRNLPFFGLKVESGQNMEVVLLCAMLVSVSVILLLFIALRPSAVPLEEETQQAEDLGESPPEIDAGCPQYPQMTLEEFIARYKISARKREVINLLLNGADTKTMAESLGITEYTVRLHIHEILRKTGLSSRKFLIQLVSKNRKK